MLLRETISVDGTVTTVMDFIYDESGRPFALKYSDDGGESFDTYYYVLNLQGDVVKLVWYIPGFEYKAVATYTYDAWGNITFLDGELAEINPLRYRGYYYDSETGFYYLQSRYYDPVNHRFINADAYASTGQGFLGHNMFAYCNNRSVICADHKGMDAIIVIDYDNALHCGHIGILVEDENGNWMHFYWGPHGNLGELVCASLLCMYPETWCVPFDGELSLDAINASGQYSGVYDNMIYLVGDFSESAEIAKNASAWTRGFYHLTLNNCSQVSLDILSQSNTQYMQLLEIASKGVVPRFVFGSLAKHIMKASDADRLNTLD